MSISLDRLLEDSWGIISERELEKRRSSWAEN